MCDCVQVCMCPYIFVTFTFGHSNIPFSCMTPCFFSDGTSITLIRFALHHTWASKKAEVKGLVCVCICCRVKGLVCVHLLQGEGAGVCASAAG